MTGGIDRALDETVDPVDPPVCVAISDSTFLRFCKTKTDYKHSYKLVMNIETVPMRRPCAWHWSFAIVWQSVRRVLTVELEAWRRQNQLAQSNFEQCCYLPMGLPLELVGQAAGGLVSKMAWRHHIKHYKDFIEAYLEVAIVDLLAPLVKGWTGWTGRGGDVRGEGSPSISGTGFKISFPRNFSASEGAKVRADFDVLKASCFGLFRCDKTIVHNMFEILTVKQSVWQHFPGNEGT